MLTRTGHWWAFHVCLQLFSVAKQLFCIFMRGCTTRKWSFPGLWRQWRHRRSPCSARDVETAQQRRSENCGSALFHQLSTEPACQSPRAPCLLTWTLGCRVWIKRCVTSMRFCEVLPRSFLTDACLCRNQSLHLQTSVGGFSVSVVSQCCKEPLLSTQFHLFSQKTNLNCSSKGFFFKHPRRGDGPAIACPLSAASRLWDKLTGLDKVASD